MALQCPMWRYPFGSGGNLVKTISPNYLFLAYRTYFELRADFIYLPINSEISLMWKTYSSPAYGAFFYYFAISFAGFFFLSAATFSGSPFYFHVASNRSLSAFPSTNGSFSFILIRKSTFLDYWLASAMFYSMIFWISYWLSLTPTPQSLMNS